MAEFPAFDFSGLSVLWTDVRGTPEAVALAAELRRELPEEHTLAGRQVEVVAARKLRKEVLLWLPELRSWAWTHLTWTEQTYPSLPSTVVCADWSEFLAALADAGRG